tara:strand:+ start:2273 stop:2548 length:276 start_codon:yes stop_codon:yes gene_type:complete
MNELFMRPDGNEDYRKFILYSFVHRDIEIKMSMYHFANDMVGYNVIQDFFESKGKLSFTNECVEMSADFITDQYNQWVVNKKAWMMLQQNL